MSDRPRERRGRRVSRRAFLRESAVTTAALSSGLPAIVPASEAQVAEVVDRDPRRTVVDLRVNGIPYRVDVPNRTTLLQVLREELKLTGTKMGCDRAQCGACTVLLNGRTVYSCTVLAVEATGGEVVTIEGLARGERLHPIQQAFIEHSGFQCGFCTPGQILSAYALLSRVPDPTPAQVRRALAGNLCRCAAYKRIVDSVLAAARLMKA